MSDRQQFEALYAAHPGAVRVYAMRRGPVADADDVVAEVFLIAWQRLHDVPVDPRAWLLAGHPPTCHDLGVSVASHTPQWIALDGLESRDSRRHAPLPGTMERVLELIDERHGGSTSWLLEHGLGEQDLQRLRRRLPLAAVRRG